MMKALLLLLFGPLITNAADTPGVLESIPVKIVPPESLMGVWIATTMMTMMATTMVTSIATMAMMTVTLATTMLLQKEPIPHYIFFEFSSFILLDMTINRRDNET